LAHHPLRLPPKDPFKASVPHICGCGHCDGQPSIRAQGFSHGEPLLQFRNLRIQCGNTRLALLLLLLLLLLLDVGGLLRAR
jgi:hypothetical protein